jgi:serine/threonine-protein kinase
MTLRAPSFTEEERVFLQQRVALFWKVVFLIALVADVTSFLLDPGFLKTGIWMDRLSTALFGLLWLICRSGRRPAGLVLAVEWVGLGTVSLLIALTGRYLADGALAHLIAQVPGTVPGLALEKAADAYMSMMCLTGGGLLFSLRAALIPSPPLRTFALTILLGSPYIVIPWFFMPATTGPPLLRTEHFPVVGVFSYAIWWAIISIGATVISRVVFGLRAEIREARRLGQYTLESKLGEGGMGVVYRARHGMMRRPTAVKLLKQQHTAEADLKRFEREVQLTARLTHPHTITIFDYGRTPDGVFYYAMELLEGASLGRVVSVHGPLPESRVVSVLYHVAGALTEAHDVGLIHRDIKPANVMLCQQGGMLDFPKVVDFGLVKDLEHAGAGLTRADVVAGTPLYLAPEAVNAPEKVGPPADLYSLGAVGYFALTGTNVFEGRTLVEVCSHHLHTPPEPPSTRLARPVDPELESLILSCLAKDPAQRPASAHEVRRRLERCAAFGQWTSDDARAWWRQNGEALSTAPQAIEETDLTLTRQRNQPRADA